MMTQWYVKELSQLTKVSVKTLHHYDKIDLLKPSVRLPNGYRLYSEKDLLRLQQILALKFFGFELSHIKQLMKEEINIYDHFRVQQSLLEQKIQSMQGASQTLETVLSESKQNKAISWKTILKLIEEYQMTKDIEYEWVKKVLNPNELKEYAHFERGLKERFTPAEEEASGKQWEDLVKEVQSNLDKDPTSNVGQALGKRCMDWVNNLFPREHVMLRTTLWHKGFKGGFTDVPQDVVNWLDEAISAYYKQRIYTILAQVETSPSQAAKQWDAILTEMCGDVQSQKDEIYEAAFADDKISAAAKLWLKQYQK
jgi:DNA-binding transcriptional MerR regulator